MEKNKKMYIINLNEKGEIKNVNDIENCSLNDFAKDYLLASKLNNAEIDETKNANVYIKYTNNTDYKIYMVNLYVLNDIKIDELIEDIEEIKTELKYRNEF